MVEGEADRSLTISTKVLIAFRGNLCYIHHILKRDDASAKIWFTGPVFRVEKVTLSSIGTVFARNFAAIPANGGKLWKISQNWVFAEILGRIASTQCSAVLKNGGKTE
jgi:hypothetical protein